ncbi:MAG: hypothetical protein COX01_03705 [Verrucomicrobia bacterium CG22_combo_CG10-13_8_21_14_all_43_17]|nr:MAG: hypothetical protein COX01_03705 [Verrucomicrobia bacterium CG22_combo_CG10-13_8_21_14_all_43_17]
MKYSLRMPAIVLLSIVMSPLCLMAADIAVKMNFEPEEICLNQKTYLKVVVEGSQATPKIDFRSLPKGLKAKNTPASAQSNIQLVNGKMNVQGVYYYLMEPEEPGDYKVADLKIMVSGQEIGTEGATLRVLGEGEKPKLAATQASDKLFIMDLNIPRERIYLGESMPASVTLFVDSRVRGSIITPYPMQVGDGFAGSPFNPEPRRGSITYAGNLYNTFTWETTITPVKSGVQDITFHLDVVVEKPRQTSGFMNSTFDNFFNDLFTENEQIHVTTGDRRLEIVMLPQLGKPNKFTGAVGDFKVRAPELSSKEISVGEPLTLRVEMTGEGNFAAAPAPTVNKVKGWKIYEPKSQFFPDDKFGYKGKKTFEYIMIPENDRIVQTPSLDYNFFDPVIGRYVENNLPSMPLNVRAVEGQVAAPVVKKKVKQEEAPKEQELLPIKLTSGKWVTSDKPVFYSPLFLTGQLVPLILILGVYFIRKRQLRLKDDTDYLRNKAAEADIHNRFHTVRKAKDAEAFYLAAQKLTCAVIAKKEGNRSEVLTWAEVATFLRSHGADESLLDDLRRFFDEADRVRFSGGASLQKKVGQEEHKTFEKLYVKLEELLNL